MSAADVLRQAEELKAAVSDTTRCANEVWVSRQKLQDIYQKLLIIDLEFALDKKVEQDLWNHAFKKQISTLQNQAKEKQNQKRGEVQSSLNLFLETASGFYLHLLQVICSAFKLDLPFRKKSSNYGIIQEYGPVMAKIRMPKKSSCMYICQDCLVHLGDIARYRQQIDQAQVYYRHAAHLVPYNVGLLGFESHDGFCIEPSEGVRSEAPMGGVRPFQREGQPYNQLAILEAAKGNKLSTVFFHIRSIAVKHPFLVAMTNLEKFYAKISKDSHEYRQKVSANELIGIFLQLHAFVHLCIDPAKAKSHADRMVASLPSHILMNSFSSYQLVQMVAINLFSLYHAKRKLNNAGMTPETKKGSANGNADSAADSRKAKEITEENLKNSFDLLFELTLSTFEVLIQSMPKDESKAKDYHTLAPIKVLLDWLHTDPDFLSYSSFKTSSVWVNLSELLNSLQCFLNLSEPENDLHKRLSTPLPEDCDLECFLPVSKAHSDLRYYSTSSETMTEEMEVSLRCQKLLMSGFWIAEEFPSLSLLNVHQLANGRIEFTTHIKPPQGSSGDHKTSRQNVAVQAIVQKSVDLNEKKLDAAAATQPPRYSSSKTTGTETKETPERLDAGVMAHSLLSMTDNDRSSEKSFSSWSPSVDRPYSGHGSTSSPGSCHSVSTETAYPCEYHPVAMPTVRPAPQQPPPPQQVYPFYFHQQGTSAMFTRPPPPAVVSESPMLTQLQPGSMVGPKMMNPVDLESAMNPDLNAVSQNGSGYTPMPKDGHFDQFGALYGARGGIRGFLPQEQMGPPTAPHSQAYFRIGQPYSFSNSVGLQPQRNVMPMYIARQEDPSSRPMAMGMMPPQPLQWSRQPLMPQGVPYMPYSSLSEPPPKLPQPLPEEYVLAGTHATFSQTPANVNLSIRDGVSSAGRLAGKPAEHDQYLLPPGAGGRFPVPPHFQQDPVNGADRIPRMPFQHLGCREMDPVMVSQFGGRPGVFGIQRNGAHMSDILDNIPSVLGSSQPAGLFQVENRTPGDLDQMPRSPDHKDKMKDNSPQPIGARPQSSLFGSAGSQAKEQQPISNTYSLFSQSPWPVRIAKSPDGRSHASSTFGSSSSSSLRTTPDPDERSSVSSGGGYRAGMFGRTAGTPANDGPWNTPSLSGNPLNSTTLPGGGALLGNSLQSLWNSGPSPLEKLLEQQKQQRQCEPH